MDAILIAVIAVAVVAAGGWFVYAAIGTALDRRKAMTSPATAGDVVELELGHAGPRSLLSRRRVLVRRDDEGVARIRLGRGVRRVRGECLANDETYVLDLRRGWPLMLARWPWARARVSMRRRSDGVMVGQAAQPRSWLRRMALRGGVELTRDGVSYELRPMQGRQRGAQLRTDGEAVGSFSPEPGSTRCEAVLPATLDEEGQLFLVATAAAFDFTLPEDVAGPAGSVPTEAEGLPRGAPMGSVAGVGVGAAGGAGGGCGAGGGGGGGGC